MKIKELENRIQKLENQLQEIGAGEIKYAYTGKKREDINKELKEIEILKELIDDHENEVCNCDLRYEGTGHCFAGAYINGEMTLEDTLEDIDLD